MRELSDGEGRSAGAIDSRPASNLGMDPEGNKLGYFEGQVLAKLDEIHRWILKAEISIEQKADKSMFEEHVRSTNKRIDSLEQWRWWLMGVFAVVAFGTNLLADYVINKF